MAVAKAEIRRLNALRDGFGTAVVRSRALDAKLATADLAALFEEVMGDVLRQLPVVRKEAVHG